MKTNIHPKFYTDCVVTCACGNTFVTGSVLPKISLDLCSKCHPFFTGTQKLIDTEGRVEKFAKRQAKAIVAKKEKELKKATPAGPRTLKEMLSSAEANSQE